MIVVVAAMPLLMLLAKDIPRANTPNTAGQCGGPELSFPPPVLASCTEPIPQGVVDLRGTYITDVGPLQLTERVEQCGKRFVVSSIIPSGYWYASLRSHTLCLWWPLLCTHSHPDPS